MKISKFYPVKGMRCEACEEKIIKQLRTLPGVERVLASHKEKSLTVEGDREFTLGEINQALKAAGDYSVDSSLPTQGVEAPGVSYRPLVVVLFYIIGSALLIALSSQHPSLSAAMSALMGAFFIYFSLFKLIDLSGFADGFASYDLLAKRFPRYGRVYPFLELALGVLFVTETLPTFANLATAILMGVGLVGVLKSMSQGQQFQCACLGSVLKVPLSKVTVIENASMLAMALLGLFFGM